MSDSHLSVRFVASHGNLYLLKQTVTNNSFDTFAVSELLLDPTVRDADILIPGYTTFRRDRRPYRRGGGVLVCVENIYKACVTEKWPSISESNFQQLWLKVLYKEFKSKYNDVLPRTSQARPKPEIYTPKRDDVHPLPFHMEVPPPPHPPGVLSSYANQFKVNSLGCFLSS